MYFISKISPILFFPQILPCTPPQSSSNPWPHFSTAVIFSYFVLIVINIHTLLSVVSLSRSWFHFTLLFFAAVTGIVLTTENLELRVTNKKKKNMWCLFFWVCDTSLNMMLSTSTYLPAKFMILFFIMAK